ncbi:aminodeoxychorismate synthase component I [Cobetia sp. 1CM21F]|uniref:aminodeoxychorismate synthase component I n=1 Tax=Cobetia sp. 1CM21F TaxID=2929163 RepID=UPI0020C100A1|nr:aminodeoxychorismate synthase component I [Cobetia sp. 1CM21F]MCK8068905.1 aminodeoxychorismate synthase component I [Cobetia sp. 1CM21F]
MTISLEINALPYALAAEDEASTLSRFARLRSRPDAVLLDSGQPSLAGGRFDIISSDPLAVLEQGPHGGTLTGPLPETMRDLSQFSEALERLARLPVIEAQRQLLTLLPQTLAGEELARHDLTAEDLPFIAGLLGYWSYDFGRALEDLPATTEDDIALPWARLGLYDWALISDHQRQQSWLIASPQRRRQVLEWLEQPAPRSADFALDTPFAPLLDRAGYGERFRQVMEYLHAGDCYQINLTQRFSADCSGDSWDAYLRLRQATPTPYAGYLSWQDAQGEEMAIVSVSPERFVEVNHRAVETKPIKGTRARGATPEEDARLAAELLESPKDRAENVMIVDLLRNDLGRVSAPGSVKVPSLCALESYANVHHSVSTITSTLDEGRDALDLLGAAFPGGSITGAPKIRAMQIIEELEPVRRSAYCGSLGYLDIRGHMDTSIAIRTAVIAEGQVHLWGGGGLVADSEEEAEYRESLAKIQRLMEALG